MIVVVGLSHKTAPIEVRERLALGADRIPEVLQALLAEGPVGEAMVVSTCNRVELILAPRSEAIPLGEVEQAAIGVLSQKSSGAVPHLYRHSGSEGLRHLFEVTASLDSMVLGEAQILGQVKEAFELSRANGAIGACLHRVLTHAIRAAKRVRTETAVGAGQVSVPTVAVDLARQIFGDFKGRAVALLGAGEMGEAVAKLLTGAGARLLIVGRNPTRVGELAARMNATARTLSELETTLAEADVIVTATSAPGYVIPHDLVEQARKKRRGRALFFIDLAVPRDVDPRVNRMDNVFLYNVDDFSRVVSETASSRRKEAEAASAILTEEIERLERSASRQAVTPLVVALRRSAKSALAAELEKSLRSRLKHLTAADREALETLFESALNKFFHHPTRRLRELAGEEPKGSELSSYVEVLQDVFCLDPASDGGPESVDSTPGQKLAPLGRAGLSEAPSASADPDRSLLPSGGRN